MIRNHFNLDSISIRREIEMAYGETVGLLRRKGVDYNNLRAALSPKGDSSEAAFLFDSEIEYGPDPFRRALRMLDAQHSCSILTGDLIGLPEDLSRALLEKYVTWTRRPNLLRSSQLYGIYINNLTPGRLESLRSSLETMPSYVGFSDVTYSSPFKTWMSISLSPSYVKLPKVFITAHPDDLPEQENEDGRGWLHEGQRYISIASAYFDTFLSFKIETQPSHVDHEDVQFSLNSISDYPLDLASLDVEITQEKLGYLQKEKTASLDHAGLSELSVNEIRTQISSKMRSNYIYNLRYHTGRGQSFFNIMLEFPREGRNFRMTVALEYLPLKQALKVITAF